MPCRKAGKILSNYDLLRNKPPTNMRIAYISGSVIPSRFANGVHVMRMCGAFAALGHEVSLIVPECKRPVIETMGEDGVHGFYGVGSDFEILRVPDYRFRGGFVATGRSAARLARQIGADLVFARSIAGAYFALRLGMEVVYETHFPDGRRRRLSGYLARRVTSSPRLGGLVVISEPLRRHFLDAGVPGHLILRLPDGADAPRTEARPALGEIAGRSRLRVGYVGHLYPGRGVDLILALARRAPWADFDLVGGLEEDIERWRRPAEELANVTFHGFVAPAETDGYRLSFDVLIAPYQDKVAISSTGSADTAAWMSPLKIFEYMACARPIVCSDLPVLREVLSHEHNALLCSPGDASDWLGALERLRADPDLRRLLAANARADFETRYSWRGRARRILGHVNEMRVRGDGGAPHRTGKSPPLYEKRVP